MKTAQNIFVSLNDQKRFREAVRTDSVIGQLINEKIKIASIVVPVVFLEKGQEKTIWFDEINDPRFKECDRLINDRIEMLKIHYCGTE